MNVTSLAAGFVVTLAGLWLVWLAAMSALAPHKAARFLSGFASSARVHYLEQALRMVAGAGFIVFASQMRHPDVFRAFGWILVITSVGLLAMPWQWHQKFAGWAVPFATRHLKLYAFSAAVLAALIFYAML